MVVSLTVDDPAWDAPAPKPAPDVWSGGARRLGGGKNSADRTLVWGAAPEAKEWTAATVASVKSGSSPEPKKKAWAAAPAWPSPSGWKKSMSMAPSICAPTEVPTSYPTTCEERRWYFHNGRCANGDEQDDKPYSNRDECCDDNNQEDGSACEGRDFCSTEVSTEVPTPYPTTCEGRRWYFYNGRCANGDEQVEKPYYNRDECCDYNPNEDGSACEGRDFCSAEVPTEFPTEFPTEVKVPTLSPASPEVETVTLSPTTCLQRMWYFSGGICSNGYDEDGSYTNLQDCCEENQPGPKCEFKDVCCMMRKWYFADGICTNRIAPEGQSFSSLLKCCENEQGGKEDCSFDDVCVPEESTTPAPSVIFTPQPSTDNPTFGSTPTVSKEVTGPPTIPRRV